MYKEGLRNRNGNKITKSTFHNLMSDPFYCGYILWNGKEFDGKHKPIITEQLFNEVQEKLKCKYKAGQQKIHFHTFKGLVKCAECGCLVSWETQKGHNYGRCKGYKPCTRKSYIKEEIVIEKLDELMSKIKPRDQAVVDWIVKALKAKNEDKKDYSASTRESLTNALKQIENRLDKMYEDKLDGLISGDYFQTKSSEFSKRKKEIIADMGKLENTIDDYYRIGVEVHELAYNARNLFHSHKATFDDRRTLIGRIFGDMQLNPGQNFEARYSPAFQFLSEWIPKLNATSELLKNGEHYKKTGLFEPAHPVLLRIVDDVRTKFMRLNEYVYIPDLREYANA
jgi:hypothetical protein